MRYPRLSDEGPPKGSHPRQWAILVVLVVVVLLGVWGAITGEGSGTSASTGVSSASTGVTSASMTTPASPAATGTISGTQVSYNITVSVTGSSSEGWNHDRHRNLYK